MTSALYDVAHDGVVERVKYSRGNDDGGYRAELRIRKAARKEHEGYDAAREQIIHHVPADRAEREHYEIFLPLL